MTEATLKTRPADAADPGVDLAQSASHLLHRAQQYASDRFVESIGAAGITQRQFAVLTAVAAQEGLTQTDLVKATGIDRSTLAELVSRMQRRGLVSRARAANDGRANTVSLTADGRAALDSAGPAVVQADEAIIAALPKNKRQAFLESLQRIARELDGPIETPADEKADKKKKKDKSKKKTDGKKTAKKAEKPKVKADKKTKGGKKK